MPKVTPAVIERFASLAAEHGAQTRARGVFDGAPGHPVALGSAYFADLMALEGDVGARDVLKRIGPFRSRSAICARGSTSTRRRHSRTCAAELRRRMRAP